MATAQESRAEKPQVPKTDNVFGSSHKKSGILIMAFNFLPLLREVVITSVLDEDPPCLVGEAGGGGGYIRHLKIWNESLLFCLHEAWIGNETIQRSSIEWGLQSQDTIFGGGGRRVQKETTIFFVVW